MKRALLFLLCFICTSLAAQNGFYLSHGLNQEFIAVRDSEDSNNLYYSGHGYTTEPYTNSLFAFQNELGWTKNHFYMALNLGFEVCNTQIKGKASGSTFSHGGNSNEYYSQNFYYTVDYMSRLAIANGGLQLGRRWITENGRLEFLAGLSIQVNQTVAYKLKRDQYVYRRTWSSSFYDPGLQTYVTSSGDTSIYQPASSFLHPDYKARLGFNTGVQSNFRFHLNERCFIDALFGWRKIWTSRFEFAKITERSAAFYGVRFGYTIGKQKPIVVKEKEKVEVDYYNK